MCMRVYGRDPKRSKTKYMEKVNLEKKKKKIVVFFTPIIATIFLVIICFTNESKGAFTPKMYIYVHISYP